jgi:hypothetical protein
MRRKIIWIVRLLFNFFTIYKVLEKIVVNN